MRSRIALILLLIAAPQAGAQDYTPMPPTEANALADTPVVPWKTFCSQLIAHQPVSNVTYNENGEQCDVHGRPVAGANLRGPQNVTMPREYRMFLTAQQAQQLNIALPNTPFSNDLLIGEVVVGADGVVTFNGRTLRTDRLYDVCRTL